MEVVVARCSGSFRRSDQGCEPPNLAERAGQGGLLDPRDPCAVQLSKVQLADLAQQRHHDIRPPQLDGEPGCREQASAAAPGR